MSGQGERDGWRWLPCSCPASQGPAPPGENPARMSEGASEASEALRLVSLFLAHSGQTEKLGDSGRGEDSRGVCRSVQTPPSKGFSDRSALLAGVPAAYAGSCLLCGEYSRAEMVAEHNTGSSLSM